MQTRHWLLAVTATFTLVGIAGGGCGGTTSDNTNGPDSGNDVTADTTHPPVDTGVDAPKDSGAADVCTVDADLQTLSPPDAALGDSGTGSVGLCIACSRTSCPSEIAACNADCECKGGISDFYACVAAGQQSFQACGFQALGALSPAAQQLAQGLALCVYAKCRQECGIPKQGGGDASNDVNNDVSTAEAGD